MAKIKNDIIFIGALVLLLAIIGGAMLIFRQEGAFVEIKVDGQIYGTYPLNENKIIEIKTEKGYNIVVIENGTARVEDASCPDGVCSSHRPISFVGASILCIPNKVVVSIASENDEGLDIVS